MKTHFVEMDTLTAYGERSWELLEWITDHYFEHRSEDFGIEYARKLQELHELYNQI